MRGILNQLRERAYDVVYHGGDTSLQFIADLIRAPEGTRTSNYHTRQLQRRERAGEKPLTTGDKQVFLEILNRQLGEGQIDYWKRKKALLGFSDKTNLVKQYRNLQQQQTKLTKIGTDQTHAAQKRKLEEEFRAITSLKHYPKHMM